MKKIKRKISGFRRILKYYNHPVLEDTICSQIAIANELHSHSYFGKKSCNSTFTEPIVRFNVLPGNSGINSFNALLIFDAYGDILIYYDT